MFYISSKNPEQNIHPLSRVIHSRTTMTTYVRIVASNSQQTTPSTRDNTADKHRASMTDRNNSQPPRHGVIKRTIGGSLARSWPPPRRRRSCVLLLLLLGLSAAAAANNRRAVVLLLLLLCASVETFVYSVCACSRTYGASSRELGERHASCDTLLSLLLQLRLLRLLRVLIRTATAVAPVCCRRFFKWSPGSGN